MAVFRVTSHTKNAHLAKKTIRYITHRRGRDGQNVTRPLFGREGGTDKTDAYGKIDKARRGTTFFRMIISPDPVAEDPLKDLDLREIMDQTMLALQEKFPRQQIEYFAAIHADHTDKRHVHVVALLRGRLTRPHLSALRSAATKEATAQRQRLDQEQGLTRTIAQQATPILRRERPTPVFVSREPRHADREVSKRPSYGGSSTKWRQAEPQRLKLEKTLCPPCGGGIQMVRTGSRLICLYCGLSVQAELRLSKSKEQGFSRERSLEEVGMS